jgi:hypothetical protein
MMNTSRQQAFEESLAQSWDEVETVYQELASRQAWAGYMLGMIQELRRRRYDHHLRAGHMSMTVVLSRLRTDGIQGVEAQLLFRLKPNGSMKIRYWEGQLIEFEMPRIAITPEIETLLARLVRQSYK